MDITFSDLNEDLPIIEEDDNEFYEHFEAPKFVDLSAPDSYPIDDRSWFCLRFGCDRQHEEFELDPEALHRDFTLRVMAARSPNVKLQRSLNKHHRSPGSIKKCPHSAPAKSVKGGTAGTNYISSIPNYSNSRLKTHPVSSLKSTPSTREEKIKSPISEKKASMTPRSKGLPTKYVPPKSAKIGNGKSLNHNDAAKASHRSSSITKHGNSCDGMKKLSTDCTKQNKTSMAMKKKIEAVSTQGDACKAISKVGVKHSRSAKICNGKMESMKHNDVAKAKVGVKHSRSAKICNGKMESMKHNDAAKALLMSNSTHKYDGICDGMKKLSIDCTKQNKTSMAMKKKIEAVSTQGDACKAIIKVGVKHSRSAKICNGKMESMKHNDAAKALLISNSTHKYDGICDGMKKLSIDSMKKNKKCMSVKKKAEAVSIQAEAISKVGAQHEIVDDIVPTISKVANQSDISKEFLKVNEVVPQISKLDNSAEFDKDKENACTTRCRKISTTNSESSESSQHKENKAPVKKTKEATLKGKVKRSTDPKPFRLRTEERRIVMEANVERKMQVKSQKENLTTSRHGDIKNKYVSTVKNHKNTLEGPKDNTSKYAIDDKKSRVTLEGPKDDTSKYVISAKTNRTTLEGSKDHKSERSIVKGANAKSNIQLKTQKKIPTLLKYNIDQNAIQGKTRKTTLEVPNAKPNLPKAPRVRYVESRFAKGSSNIHKLQSETKVVQNKVIKTCSSIPNTQRVSNVRKTMISQTKVAERNGTMANATCLKGKRQSVANKETKFANSSVRG